MRDAEEQAANKAMNPVIKKNRLNCFMPEKDISGKLLYCAG
jgi:hypothetical protein